MMRNWLVSSLFVLFLVAGSARGSAIFYSDLASFNAAVAGASLTTGLIDFESVPVGSYNNAAGVTTGGLNFTGPFSGSYFLWVNTEAAWGGHFAPGTGNTINGIGEIDITLPAGTRAFGANMGNSYVWATGGSAAVAVQLSSGESDSTPTSLARLFPFFGFVSDSPVSSLILSGASFVTIDNVRSGSAAVTSPVPEPSTLWLSAGAIVLALARSRRR
jgi:hypothetical protein